MPRPPRCPHRRRAQRCRMTLSRTPGAAKRIDDINLLPVDLAGQPDLPSPYSINSAVQAADRAACVLSPLSMHETAIIIRACVMLSGGTRRRFYADAVRSAPGRKGIRGIIVIVHNALMKRLCDGAHLVTARLPRSLCDPMSPGREPPPRRAWLSRRLSPGGWDETDCRASARAGRVWRTRRAHEGAEHEAVPRALSGKCPLRPSRSVSHRLLTTSFACGGIRGATAPEPKAVKETRYQHEIHLISSSSRPVRRIF